MRFLSTALAITLGVQLLSFSLPMTGHAEPLKGVDLTPGVNAIRGASQATARSIGQQAEPAYALQTLDEDDNRLASVSRSQPLQGTVTSIRVTRGRSQIVKFAQPIMRMSIAEPTVADIIPLSPDQIMINGKLRGVTSLIVWDENGQEGIFDLYVQNDTSEVLDAVAAIAPNEKIQMRITDDTFILTGQVSNSVILDEIRQLAAAYGYRDSDDPKEDKFKDLTDTPVPQVQLEVRIAEVNRSTLRNMRSGLAYNNDLHRGDTMVAGSRFDTVGLPGSGGNNNNQPPVAIGSLSPMVNPAIGGITNVIAHQAGSLLLLHRLDALESTGKVNTLANPTLVCTHGRTASFLAGGEFPFVGSVDQNGSPVIQFKEFGVKLNFTPWIAIKSGRIELKVEPEVSNLDTSNCVQGAAGLQVCGLLKRRAETTVELQDGDTLMIAGILSREEQNLFAKVPFIGNVPVLGNMFKNADMRKTDRELVVVITPRIIKPNDYGKILGSKH